MKKIILGLICAAVTLCACTSVSQTSTSSEEDTTKESLFTKDFLEIEDYEIDSFTDSSFLEYLANIIYTSLREQLDDSYLIDDVKAVYVSQEYIDELEYNSLDNLYFGYSEDEVDEYFADKKYVFTLDDDGTVVVKAFENFDDSYRKMIKNVALGSGIILFEITAAVVTSSINPPLSFYFAVTAGKASSRAIQTAAYAGVFSGLVEGLETGNINAAAKKAAYSASEGYLMGAIMGTAEGIIDSGIMEYSWLKSATASGLSLKEAMKIQKESKYSLTVISQIHSMEEYEIYKNAELIEIKINDRTVLARPDIDLNQESEVAGTIMTNLERMQHGYAPVDAEGNPIQLHHVFQEDDGVLAMLTGSEHQGNASILNTPGKARTISDSEFAKQKKEIWKGFAKIFEEAM